jgi:hypothetical protein
MTYLIPRIRLCFSMVYWLTCLPLYPRFAGPNPDEDDRLLKDEKILSTTSFVGGVKPSAPYLRILRHVKDPCGI